MSASDGGFWRTNIKPYLAGGPDTLIRVDGNGNLLWVAELENGKAFYNQDYPYAVAGNSDLELFAPTYKVGNDSLYLEKIAPDGSHAWTKNLSQILNLPKLRCQLSVPLADKGFLLALDQRSTTAPYNLRHFFAKITQDGSVVWHKMLSRSEGDSLHFVAGRELADGSILLAGTGSSANYYNEFLIKLAPDGTIHPNKIIGQVLQDLSEECIPGFPGAPKPGWAVQAEDAAGAHYFGYTDDLGQYTIGDLDTGTFEVRAVSPNFYWGTCEDSQTSTFDGSETVDTLDFSASLLFECPLMQVDVGVSGWRRCSSGVASVAYVNRGSMLAQDVSLQLWFDPLLSVQAVSLPYSQLGSVLTFDLGTVQPDSGGTVYITFGTDCDDELGRSICLRAHVFPDSLCAPSLPDWSGARVELSGACEGDSVRFSIENKGVAPTSQGLEFIIVDDHVITKEAPLDLPPGSVRHEILPADGSTWRLIAQQEPGFPFGPARPSIGVEGCNGDSILGMLNMFANFSGNPFEDEVCRPLAGSFDPNDKAAYPEGADSEHFIEPNQPIEYRIRFQNTGNDTAFSVILRDTLSPWLDPTSVRPGASSHPYRFSVSGAGVLSFYFQPIALPDSVRSPLASQGFVQFEVEQGTDLLPGTRIENRAGIYFDQNAPVMTNTVFHTVGLDFLDFVPPGNAGGKAGVAPLEIWPNPARRGVQTWLRSPLPFRYGQKLAVFDAAGHLIFQQKMPGRTAVLLPATWPAGTYFLQVFENRKVVASGKLSRY